jgi:outer membrane protein
MKLRIFVLLFIFAACSQPAWAMGRKPAAPVPAEGTAPAKRVIDFEEAYRLALRRSETIAISREEIAKAKASWLRASGDFIGDGNFIMTNRQQDRLLGSGGSGGVESSSNAVERRQKTIVITQPLFQGFRSLGAMTGAGNLSGQRRNEYQRSKELLFLDVASAFYGLLRQRKDVETIEGIHSLLDERIRELDEREQIGRSRISELATARSRTKIIEAELAESRGALAIAESLMEFYTGVPSTEAIYEDEMISKEITVGENYSLIAEDRVDVEAARQAMKVAKKAVIVAQSELWPEITLDLVHYEKREGFQAGINWDALFTINVPLYKGGTTVAAVKEAYHNWKQAKWHFLRTKREAEFEIKEAHQNWLASLAEGEAYREALKASEENYRLQKEDYQKNLVNNLDVLDALEELFNTGRDANGVEYDMKQHYWRLQTAMGNCCPDGPPASSNAPVAGETS